MFDFSGLTFDDVIMVPQYSEIYSRRLVDIGTTLKDLSFQTPIISSNMDTITGEDMAIKFASLGSLPILHRFMPIEDNVKLVYKLINKISPRSFAVSVGVTKSEKERSEALYNVGARIFCVDVAHGHSKYVGEMVSFLKMAKDIIVIAGNVCTKDATQFLVGSGADVVKVGIGPGSNCSTRVVTGHGYPQLQAISECSQIDIPIIADGGIRDPGDAIKALSAGASFVMLGSALAGTLETPGKLDKDGYKSFRGMASKEANEDMYGKMDEWKTAEGISTRVLYRGPVEEVIRHFSGGIRSGLTYSGARDIKELQLKAKFLKVSPSAFLEGKPRF